MILDLDHTVTYNCVQLDPKCEIDCMILDLLTMVDAKTLKERGKKRKNDEEELEEEEDCEQEEEEEYMAHGVLFFSNNK